MIRRAAALVIALVGVTAVLAGCGGDKGEGGGDAGAPVTPGATENRAGAVEATAADADLTVAGGDLYLELSQGTVAPGTLTIAYRNEGALMHTLLFDGAAPGFRLEVPTKGATDSGTVELEAGDYVLYCDVAGHRASGMETTLTVR